ncbi:MAG: chitin disaccharide deacetylase [Culicoidibacterales bacterium]
MKLLFNADDFGISSGVNQGIIEAFTEGVVRSTTLMTNLGETTHEAIALAKAHPTLDIGIHLNMFLGPSLTGFIAGCTDENGDFFKWIQTPYATPVAPVDWEALKRELHAQIDFAFTHGLKPTHLDSHRHGHLHPEIFAFVCELAEKYQLRLRNYDVPAQYQHLTVTDDFSAQFYDDQVSLNQLQHLITSAQVDSLEFMCHPAHVDELLRQRSSYLQIREKELAILTDPVFITWLADNGHEIISFQS